MKKVIPIKNTPTQKRKQMSDSRKKLRKLIRKYAQDKLLNSELPNTQQAALYAGFHYCMRLVTETIELASEAKDDHITFDMLLEEIDNLWNNTSYGRTCILQFLHPLAVDRELL